jgi:hypothetical protein
MVWAVTSSLDVAGWEANFQRARRSRSLAWAGGLVVVAVLAVTAWTP